MYGTLLSVENTMDREHIKGATEKAKGAIKETAGKMTGDEKLRTEGKLDRAKGAAHKVAGDMREATHQGPREPTQQSQREPTQQSQREPAHHGPKSSHE
jgi:uncharacterized protein YjbJ (UPF0337 family)